MGKQSKKISQKIILALGASLVLASGSLVACGSPDTSVGQPQQDTVPGIKVALVNAGELPRSVLSYGDPTDTQNVTLRVTQGLEQHTESVSGERVQDIEDANTDIPYGEVSLSAPLKIDSGATGSGNDSDQRSITYVLGRPEGTNVERNEDIASAEGFTMNTSVGETGRPFTRSFAAPDAATDSARASVESALTKMNSFPVIFPQEQVGVGATWTVQSRVEGAVSMQQIITYTLKSVKDDPSTAKKNTGGENTDGKTIVLGVTVERSPNVTSLAGTDLQVMDSSHTSSGELTINSLRPAPVSGSITVEDTIYYGQPESDLRVVQKETLTVAFDK